MRHAPHALAHLRPRRAAVAAGLILTGAAIAGGCPAAAPSPAERVQEAVERYLEAEGIPGATVAILEGPELTVLRAWGFADLEAGTPMTPETRLQIGSISKQVTAAAVLELARTGRLSLDDPVGRYLPELPRAWRPVPVRALLHMTAGLPEFVTDSGYEAGGYDFSDPAAFDRAALLRLMASRPPAFEPGARWSYSNTNYTLLGLLVERVTGEPFYEHLRSTLLVAPELAGIRPFGPGDPAEGEARGYFRGEQGVEPAPALNPETTIGDGGLSSDAASLARWGRALARGPAVHPDVWTQAIRPARLADGTEWPYGAGLHLRPLGRLPRVWHTGIMPGFSAALAHYPERDLTVAVLVNLGNAGAERLEAAVTRAYLGLEPPLVRPVPLRAEERDRVAGVYDLAALWARVEVEPEDPDAEGGSEAEPADPGAEAGFEAEPSGPDAETGSEAEPADSGAEGVPESEPEEADHRALWLVLTSPGEEGTVYLREPLIYLGDGLFVGRDDPEFIRVRFPAGDAPPETAVVDAVGSRWQAVRRAPALSEPSAPPGRRRTGSPAPR